MFSLVAKRGIRHEETMAHLLRLYRRIASASSSLQSVMLLAVRLYWGFQFAQTGWGKLHNLAKITGFFASLNIPFPGFTAPFVSTLEFVGGILLMLGLVFATRRTPAGVQHVRCILDRGP